MYTFYLRKEPITPIDNPDYENLSKTSKSVIHLVSSLPTNWHHIFVDNLYSNVDLFKYLYVYCKVVCSGTWRTNNGVPNCLKLKKSTSKAFLESQENQRSIAANKCDEISTSLVLTGCSFYGTKGKHVHFLTTGRYNWNFINGGIKQKTKLDAIHQYNSLMHGNDILDSIVSFYSVYFRSKRWTIRLASWVIDVAVSTGYINATYLGMERNSDCLHAAWIGKLIDQLIERSGVQPTEAKTICDKGNSRFEGEFIHYPVHVGHKNNRKYCVVCSKGSAGDKIKQRTYYKCNYCEVGLCIDKDCFKLYHTKKIF